MSDPTDNFSSDLDPYRLLAQMYGGGLFGPSPQPSWSDYGRVQCALGPSLFSVPVSDTPGFHRSPAVLKAMAAADPRPPGFYRSPAVLGASAMVPSFDSNLAPAVGPQAMLSGRPGLSPMSLPPLPPSWLGVTPVSFPPPSSPPATGASPPGAQPSPVTPVNSPTDVPNVTPTPATGQEPPSTVGRSGVAPPVEPPSNSLELEQEFQRWPGQIRLPNGLPVRDPKSPTGYLMSPFSDLSDVAAAGRRLGVGLVERVFDDPRKTKDYAKAYLNHYVGQGGAFDYQRRAYPFGKDGLTQLKQFRNVSDFNVGVITQQASLPLIFVLWLAGKYAAEKSNNYKPINRSASIHVQGNGSKRDIVPVHVVHSIHRSNRENKTRRRIRSIAGRHLRRQTLPQRMAITEDAAANKRPSS